MKMFCGRAWRCCFNRHWWVTLFTEDNDFGVSTSYQICGRKGCDETRHQYNFPEYNHL